MENKQHPMPVLTEQQRNELTWYLSASKEERWQKLPALKRVDLAILAEQIALASLTAEPNQIGALDDRGDEYRLTFYSVPPVPVLTQPASQPEGIREDALCDTNYARGVVHGWNLAQMGDSEGMANCIEARIAAAVPVLSQQPVPVTKADNVPNNIAALVVSLSMWVEDIENGDDSGFYQMDIDEAKAFLEWVTKS